ncbi:MAG TPA: hypothetical protein VGN57_16940 [Pirellulaceae bacterium]|jgi:hypothetical protein|nr:hypothetical protein [Pirellulaceae bacterium]
MKRAITAFLLVSLAAACVGCGPSESAATVPDNPLPMPPEPQAVPAAEPGATAPAPVAP